MAAALVSTSAGARNGQAAQIREALRGARVLLHLAWAETETEPLPLRVRHRLLPLTYLLAAAGEGRSRIERVVLVSDASLYGEGSYTCPVNGAVNVQRRREEDLRLGRWEQYCPICAEPLLHAPTAETHPSAPLAGSGTLVYAQERIAMHWALERRIPVVALRCFEMYGAGTGSTADKLAERALAGLPVEVSEDGGQTRDYVALDDVTRAVGLALRVPCRELVLNVASGVPRSALAFAACLEKAMGKPLRVRVTGNFTRGEARHLYAQTGQLARLGFVPAIDLQHGLDRLLQTLSEGSTVSRPRPGGGLEAKRLPISNTPTLTRNSR